MSGVLPTAMVFTEQFLCRFTHHELLLLSQLRDSHRQVNEQVYSIEILANLRHNCSITCQKAPQDSLYATCACRPEVVLTCAEGR